MSGTQELDAAPEQRIFSYLRERYGFAADEPLADIPLQQFLDSLGILSLINFIEREFSVRVETDVLNPSNFGTPAMVVRLVATLLA